MSPTAAGAVGVGVLLLLIFLRMPIGFAMALIGFLGMTYLADMDRALFSLGMIPFISSASFVLTTIPLFILMGQFAYRSGMSEEIFGAAQKWLGHLPGGLAMATMGACGVFAAAMGSSTAEAASMGVISIDAMRRRGYDPGFAGATVAVGGTLGILIPPSLTFIIYGAITEESIGKLFMAGIIPGIAAALVWIVYIGIRCWRQPQLAPAIPKEERATLTDKLLILRKSILPILLILLVLTGQRRIQLVDPLCSPQLRICSVC